MDVSPKIGIDVLRKEAWNKVTGTAKYNDDTIIPGILHGKILTSPYAHAKIRSIDISQALSSPGVHNIITGEYSPILTGSVIVDRPPLAIGKVRYFGEPVALVIANSQQEANIAVQLIKVEYEQLPIVNSIYDALKSNPTLVHENLGQYDKAVEDVYPIFNTNISNHVKIRKGNIDKAWAESQVIVESVFSLPQSDHLAMETRNARAEILPNGNIIIHTSSQGPFSIKKDLSHIYNIPEGKIIVRTPLVGGAFGGKATLQLEILAYLGSKSVGGRAVRISHSREEDISTAPSKIGTEAKLKIGATIDGKITALECSYYVDNGAYSDTGPRIAKAMAADVSGPYNIENIHCDVFSIYTNHVYVTSYRGFGHVSIAFCMERILDKLAKKLNMDPLDLRMKNSLAPKNLSPTGVEISLSNTGNLHSCISKLKQIIDWDEGNRIILDNGNIRAKGISCFWKTSVSPTNATSGVILSFNNNGSINLNCGGVEIGPGTKTVIAQILAEKMKMDIDNVHVFMDVDTQVSPEHWKTVASMGTVMIGNAVLQAADDLIRQILEVGAIAFRCPSTDLDFSNGKLYEKSNPEKFIPFKELVYGYVYPDNSTIGGQIIGRGNYTVKHLGILNKDLGYGQTGVSWTVGAQGIEIEYNPKLYSYRLLKATTVIDVGKVLNPKTAKGVIMGGMSMGLGLATREEFIFDDMGILENTSLRTYKLLRYGEQPEYVVDFIENPQIDGPYGARGLAEHGIIGIPSAVANAISIATETDFDKLPISPELIWNTKTGGKI